MKRMVALLLAVCVMASTAAPVFAAGEMPLAETAVSQSPEGETETTAEREPALDEAVTSKAASEEAATSEGTSGESQADTATSGDAATGESTSGKAATDGPASDEAEAGKTEINATQPGETPSGEAAINEAASNGDVVAEVPVVENEMEKAAAVKKAAPQIPGFELYTSSKLDLTKEYLVVTRGNSDACKDELYALYLSDAGKSLNPGALKGVDGTVTAKLTLADGTVSAAWLKDGSSLSMEDLTLVAGSMDKGFSLQNARSGNYLALAEGNMVAEQAVNLTMTKAGDSWQIKGASRVLDFNRKGDTTQYPNNITDFWGPRSLAEGKSYTLWLYARDITLNETELKIDGYTQVDDEALPDGVYAVVGYDNGFRVLSTEAQGNAGEAVRDDKTGKLTNAETALAGADLSLTSTENGVYLTAMTEDGPVYLGLDSKGVFRSDAPVLLTVTKNENNTYTLSAGTSKLALVDGAFTAGEQGSAVQLFRKKTEQPALVRTRAVVEQGYAGTSQLAVAGGTEWICTDAKGAHPARVEWTLTENPDGAFQLKDGVLTAVKASGTGTATGKLVYTADKTVDLGSVALTACGPRKAITGTTRDQPFVNGEPDNGNGKNYRIPSLITLDNGWMVAASDMRWQTTADSPQNLDTIVSVSKDGGKTWSYEIVNYFDDQANSATGQASASFIDPSMVQGPDGKLYMVVDACPSYAGLMYGNRMGNQSSGFDEQGRMLVALADENADAPKDKSAYTYRVDLNAEPTVVTVQGIQLKLYPITTETGEPTGQWVNAELDLFAWDGVSGTVEKVMREQLSSSEMVQTNLFYRSSAWKAYPVFYIMLRSAEVTADGLVWGEPTFLDIKYTENESFTGVCPGRGLVTTVEGKQRIVFPLYDNASGQEYASVIYSDDNGATWTRGARVNNLASGGKTSESQVVNLPDGGMRIFCRNLGGQITFADSYDGGKTWGQATADSALNYTSNCMVSFINAAGYVKSPEGKVYGDLVIASYPAGSGRTDGVVRVGSMSAATGTITWLNDAQVDFKGRYQYSCLTQKQGDALGLLFESGTAGPGSTENGGAGSIYYTDLTITGMLGEGWSYLTEIPELTLNTGNIACEAGDTVQLSAAVKGMPQDTTLQWTLTADGETPVASLDKAESAASETVTLTAEAAGKATLTVTARMAYGEQALTLSDSVRVYVSDKDTVILPDGFENGKLTEGTARSENPLLKMKTTIEDGVYAIVSGGKALYSSAGGSAADQVSVADEAGELNLNTGFAANTQLWKLTKTEQGYTLESMARPGWYLAVEGETGGKYPPVKATPTYFAITGDGEGGYTISTQLDGATCFLSQNGKFCITAGSGSTMALYRQFALQAGESYYRTDASGLKKLIDYLEGLDESLYTPASWNRMEEQKEAAEESAALDGALFAGQMTARAADAKTRAQQAQQQINDATTELFRAVRSLEKQADVRYTVTFKITGDYFADERFATRAYTAGQAIEAPAAPAHEGYTFSGWQNLPRTMPEQDLVVTGSYTRNASEPEQPGQTPAPAPTPVPTPGQSGSQGGTQNGGQSGTQSNSGNTAAPSASATAAPVSVLAQTGDALWPLAGMAGLALACAAGLVLLRRKRG